MPKFIYVAKSQPYQITRGEIEAESQQDALNRLTKSGYFPISISQADLSFSNLNIITLRKISHRDIVLFTRHLSGLIESGVNIINGLNIISNQLNNKYLRAIVRDVANRIKDGASLSDSLEAFPNSFPPLYSSMIRAGEASGNLNETLKRLAEFLEKEDEFRSSLLAGLTYPFFILSVGILTIAVLLLFVIPRFVTMFEDMGQALPLPTQILINTSIFLKSYWWVIASVIFLAAFLLSRILRSPGGRLKRDRLKLKIVILGPITLKTEISRLMRTLSLLLASGMPITPSLDIAMSVLENQVLKLEVQKFKEQIRQGLSLSAALRGSKFFPELLTNIVAIGEESGSLEKPLLRIAQDYEMELDRILKTLSRLLEPIMILVMGLIVGFIVFTILLPIFEINLLVR